MQISRGLIDWMRRLTYVRHRCVCKSKSPSDIGPEPLPRRRQDGAIRPALPRHQCHAEPLERQSVAVHARRLLDWLSSSVWRGQRELVAKEIAAAYREMCAEQGLEPCPWNPVGAAFARLIQAPGKPVKTYAYVIDPTTGMRNRQRIYRIPENRPSASVLPLRRGATP